MDEVAPRGEVNRVAYWRRVKGKLGSLAVAMPESAVPSLCESRGRGLKWKAGEVDGYVAGKLHIS